MNKKTKVERIIEQYKEGKNLALEVAKEFDRISKENINPQICFDSMLTYYNSLPPKTREKIFDADQMLVYIFDKSNEEFIMRDLDDERTIVCSPTEKMIKKIMSDEVISNDLISNYSILDSMIPRILDLEKTDYYQNSSLVDIFVDNCFVV